MSRLGLRHLLGAWVSAGIFQRGKYFKREKFEIHGAVTVEGPENRNRTAKSVNILKCFKLVRSL